MTDLDYVRTINKSRSLVPIVICGVARSGTRMATDLLNLYPDVAIQEEIHANSLEAFFRCVKEIDSVFEHYSERKGRDLSLWWQKSRSSFLHNFFISANKKGSTGAGKLLKYHGVKTPGYERYFDEFEAVFSETPPKYLYCLRRPDYVWRSWKSMGYLTQIDVFKARYERSLRQALRIKKRASDRFCVFELDEFSSALDKSEFLNEKIGKRLGIETKVVGLADQLENRNSIEKRGRDYIDTPSLADEMDHLMQCPKVRDYRTQLVKP